MKKYLLIIAAAGLMLTSCSPFSVKSDYDQTVNFNQYKTFSIRQDDLKLNDIDKARVINAIEQQMKAKGFTETENGDVIVNVKASHKNVTDIQTGSPWGVGFWGRPYWGMGLGMYYSPTYSYNYNRGALEIDLVDAKSQKLIWQGIGNGLDVDSPSAKQKQVPELVGEILKNYPPQLKK